MKKKKSVAKFGGSSVIKYPKKIKEIFQSSDLERDFIVVSAPGKKDETDEKLTDILINISKKNKISTQDKNKIIDKFKKIGINFDKEKIIKILDEAVQQKESLNQNQYQALIVSLGEKMSALVYADFLGAQFLDAGDIFVVKTENDDFSQGVLDFSATAKKIKNNFQIKTGGKFVVPGFYGKTKDGLIATFPRGGSDLSGAYLAYFLELDLYENFTDFPILSADPRIVKNPHQIENITHEELRDLTYAGFSILHPDVVLPLAEKDITTEIKSTLQFPVRGTMTTKKRKITEKVLAVTGVKNFFILQIGQNGLNEIDYITADILRILKDNQIPIEHITSGIDDISIILDNKYLSKIEKIKVKIKKILNPKIDTNLSIKENVGLICVAGQGMKNEIGLFSEITRVLSQARINIIALNQPSTERNIIIFVDKKNIDKAIKKIYQKCIK